MLAQNDQLTNDLQQLQAVLEPLARRAETSLQPLLESLKASVDQAAELVKELAAEKVCVCLVARGGGMRVCVCACARVHVH
jgi:hypothetical protein